MDPPTGKAPDQESVGGSEGETTLVGQGACLFHMVQNPADLGGGKIGIEQQTGSGLNLVIPSGEFQLVTETGRSPILPDDGVVDGFSGFPVPHHGGFPLVGDAETRDGPGLFPAPFDGLATDTKRGGPDLFRIVLHPTQVRENLPKLLLGREDRVPVRFEQDRTGAGSSLVDTENQCIISHLCPLFSAFHKKAPMVISAIDYMGKPQISSGHTD